MSDLDEAMRRADWALLGAASKLEVRMTREAAEAARKAALASLAASGWVLVPRQATEDMLATGKIAAVTTHRVDQVYESMVAVAPKVPPCQT